MKKKLLSIVIVGALLVGCGGKTEEAAVVGDAAVVDDAAAADPFYIYSWDTKLQERLSYVFAKYPEIEERVVYVNVDDSGLYQKKIDALLATPDAENYPDMMATEAGYIMKYTNSDYTLPVTDLGLTDADLAEMYPYTIQIATDQRDGSLKGVSWQSCPGAYMYRIRDRKSTRLNSSH